MQPVCPSVSAVRDFTQFTRTCCLLYAYFWTTIRLEKTSNFFLSNCEPGIIDHGNLKDSDFEDDRQPESDMAAKTGSLRQIPSKFQISNGKSGIFDHGQLDKSVAE